MDLLNNPTLLIVAINIALIMGSYLWYFPCFVRDNLSKLLVVDTVLIVLAVIIAGILFWGKGMTFSLFGWSLGWFAFTLFSYFLIELPFSIVYSLYFFHNRI